MTIKVRTRNGNAIFWNGHLCEGCRIISQDANTFLLWTLCAKHDVPANQAWEKRPEDIVTCPNCAEIAKGVNQ